MRKFPEQKNKEFWVFKRLNSPSKIQDFLNAIPINFGARGDSCQSPLRVLRNNKAQCVEGAMLAAAIFWYHGQKPLLLDLRTTREDDDHVVTLFRYNNRWGAVSKTNHAVLHYRDPIYATIRELVLSYFNEYFLDNGKKTLRSYSAPFSLLNFEDDWLTTDENIWGIPEELDDSKHYDIADKKTIQFLRKADLLEIEAGKIVEWRKP
ncbi:MAG: hypothetical protein G01um101448_472 [Parcubacteria group bacterium Gr01-1014_48]|nr:MAG: hypothetical protein Greene041614_700 [Parcubacteria group bacterium Greene0416_14]TSC73893.1 MAG: hypothetical protein G01um101448_472 [Parcubacteria group bacterium Gr01-1014_48]TSD01560.1 MAG: hypothetical protein Greene101415_140 [Parcubacteria group bacterium Greene1014_15]TSD08140.1 MAG: hypothetical protein Greene07144_375 [Parcubacteria group bacterium Greene0714_4]